MVVFYESCCFIDDNSSLYRGGGCLSSGLVSDNSSLAMLVSPISISLALSRDQRMCVCLVQLLLCRGRTACGYDLGREIAINVAEAQNTNHACTNNCAGGVPAGTKSE